MSRNISSQCMLILAILSSVMMTGNGVVLDCYTTTVSEYDGHQHTTASGIPCLRWDQFNQSNLPDASISDAANFCRAPDGFDTPWCHITYSRSWKVCGINKCGDDGLKKCGQLSIDKPTILGRYVTFSFTPDTYDPNAILEWQRSMNGIDQWKTLPLNNNFTQYEKNWFYYLILTDTEKNKDEGFYRIHYYNETIHCWMDAGELTLEAINNSCGLVYLRSEKVIVNGTVEIEYYPSTNVMQNSSSFERRWIHSVGGRYKVLTLVGGSYEETLELNNKYVLTILMFNISMNGEYGVYCGPSARYTDFITVKLPANSDSREAGDNMSTTANPDDMKTSDYMSTAEKTENVQDCSICPCTTGNGVGLGAVIGSVITASAVGILIGVICTMFIRTRKGCITGSKTQPTVSHEIELTGPPTAVDTYEQLQNRTGTEIRGTYDSLEVNSRVQQNSQSQYESLNQEAETYHTYTDLKQSR